MKRKSSNKVNVLTVIAEGEREESECHESKNEIDPQDSQSNRFNDSQFNTKRSLLYNFNNSSMPNNHQ